MGSSSRRTAFLLALVVVCLAVCVAEHAVEARRHRKLRSAANNRRTDFDFFFLVRQWPASFCNEHYCAHRPPKRFEFTVHGMWPQRRDGTWPEFCDPSSHVDVDALDDIMDDMEHDWPSWSGPDETFWEHEWTRHGTCAAPVTGDAHRFFKTVLTLHEKYPIQAALSRAGITPSNSKRYPVQDIKDAIEDMYGVMPHVTCDQKGELAEVWMCVNKKLRMIDCVEDPRPPHNSKGSATAAASGTNSIPARDDSNPEGDELTSAPVPPNWNCNMVTIPKLQKHWGKTPGLDAVADAAAAAATSITQQHDGHAAHKHSKHHEDEQEDEEEEDVDAAAAVQAAAEAVVEAIDVVGAELAASIQPLAASVASVAADAKGMVQQVAASLAASLADDAGSSTVGADVAVSVANPADTAAAVAVTTPADPAPAATTAPATTSVVIVVEAPAAATTEKEAVDEQEQQAVSAAHTVSHPAGSAVASMGVASRPIVAAGADVDSAAGLTAGPNQHLPLLAGVVVGVIAAAVVAAAVALRAHSSADEVGSSTGKKGGRKGGYMPPSPAPVAVVEAAVAPGEAAPLLAV